MKEYYGRCHCGNINFAFQSEESVEIWKCNCSICCLYDYEHLFIKHEEFSLIKGKTKISCPTLTLPDAIVPAKPLKSELGRLTHCTGNLSGRLTFEVLVSTVSKNPRSVGPLYQFMWLERRIMLPPCKAETGIAASFLN